MIKNPCAISCQGLAAATKLTLVQHKSLGSWDVFLSLFSSLAEGPFCVDIVLLQDPPSSKGFLPSFQGFKSFAPPITRPRVACYVSLSLLKQFAVLPFCPPESDDFMALDVYTPKGCFGLNFPCFRIGISMPDHSPRPPTLSPPREPSRVLTFPIWSPATLISTMRDLTLPDSFPRRKEESPPHTSTEPRTWATHSLIPLTSIPSSHLQELIDQAPWTLHSLTQKSFLLFAHGTHPPCPLQDQTTRQS